MKTANITDDIIKPAQDRADCNITSCGDNEWTARQNDRYGFKLSDVLIPIKLHEPNCWAVDGALLDMEETLGTALLRAFRERRVRNAADRLGLAVKKGHGDDTWYVVDPQDEEASVEVCFYDGYCHIAGNQARVKNVSVANLVKHLKVKMAHARHIAQHDRFQEECDKARAAAHAAFVNELRSLGLKSNDKRTLKIDDSTRHEDGTWTFEVAYQRKDDTLTATIKAKDVGTVLNKVAILDSF